MIILLEFLVQVKTNDLLDEMRSFDTAKKFDTLDEKVQFILTVLNKAAQSGCEIYKQFFSGKCSDDYHFDNSV